MATGLVPASLLLPGQKPPRGSRLRPGATLGRNPAGLWLFNEGGGPRLTNLATGQGAAVTAGTWVASPIGPALAFNGSTTDVTATDVPGFGAPLTLLVDVSFNPIVSSQMLVERETVNSTWALMVLSSAVRWRGSSATDRVASTSLYTLLDADEPAWHTLAVTDDGTTARLYCDGVLFDEDTAGDAPAATASPIHFGNYDASSFFLDGRLGRVGLWPRVLSAAELAGLALGRTPYALVAPPAPAPGQWYVTIAAAGGGGAAAGNRWRRTGAKQVSQLKQSSTAQALCFPMIDELDHATPKTGLTPTVTLSKAGAAFASPAGAVTEIGSGWYKVAGNATDTDTLGALILHATATGADPTDVVFQIVAYDPQSATDLGLTNIATATSTLATQASVNTIDDFVDTEVAAILAAVDTEVAAIKAKTDLIPAAPAAVGDIPTANANADALLDRANAFGTRTLRQLLKAVAAGVGGKLSGAGTATNTIRDLDDTKDVIVATVDAPGNRSAITYDVS